VHEVMGKRVDAATIRKSDRTIRAAYSSKAEGKSSIINSRGADGR